MRYIIYDLECLRNCFTHTSIDRDTGEIHQFVIHESRNDYEAYMEFLKEVEGMIGYNNLNYDYALLHELLTNDFPNDPELICVRLFTESQDALGRDFPKIPTWEMLIPQLDLFRIHHFDNKNKRTSLKQIEIAMGLDNVEDILVNPYSYVDADQIQMILDYNLNDVLATKRFYELSRNKIELRKGLRHKVWMDLSNANDPKIGSRIFAERLSDRLGISTRELKEMGTPRNRIDMNDVILDKIKFDSPKLQGFLDSLKKQQIYDTKGEVEYNIILDQMKYTIALGGIHACRESNIYKETGNEVIIDSDVASYYPNLSISNRFYPEHLGIDFCIVYEEIYRERKQYPKGSPENMAFKLALNGAYGKSNERTSFLYDPLFTMRITMNGQLFLLMLCERVSEFAKVLMANTDGITVIMNKADKPRYYNLCDKWMEYTGLELEHAAYRKMVIRDVNNYLAIDTNGKVKMKGTFQTNDDKINKEEWHKSFSQNIVKIALKEYFVNGTPIRDTIINHDNILDFCKTLKLNSGWEGKWRCVDKNGDLAHVSTQKTNRYYVSTKGGSLVKINPDGDETKVESGVLTTIYNRHRKMKMADYKINYSYYINEAEKIRRVVEPAQLTLF